MIIDLPWYIWVALCFLGGYGCMVLSVMKMHDGYDSGIRHTKTSLFFFVASTGLVFIAAALLVENLLVLI